MSNDVWMYVLSAAIGSIISFLVLKFWNSPKTEATRKPKVPMEHDERQMEDDAHFTSRCVEGLRRDEKKERKLVNFEF